MSPLQSIGFWLCFCVFVAALVFKGDEAAAPFLASMIVLYFMPRQPS